MPELRKDPITGRWVIIASDRAKRPTDFNNTPVKPTGSQAFCPFCYGNESKTPPEILAYRSEGAPNTPGWTVRVVPNKFPALGIEGELARQGEGVYDKMNGIGAHEVIIETPNHDQTLASLPTKNIEDVLWAFRDRMLDLKKDSRFRYILIFKNHGEPAGASLEHTHSQLIALPIVPRSIREQVDGAKQYYDFKERCIYCDIIRQELETKVRVVAENEDFVTLSPYAPRFPFETWIFPKRHEAFFEQSSPRNFENLAKAIKSLLMRSDQVLDCPAYNLVLQSAPLRESHLESFHWHIEYMPRLTRIAGFEAGTGFYINPTTPEEAARYLREVVVEDPVTA
ncbi:MAG TPA: galactose-1-phosphate uridylyltransferase [Terriglobales bacterium]|nr:galactose-1-phosphate uridylyltransferase [Terriglobales bacterium]